MIFLQLFWRFLQVGLFSIGGGYAAIPVIQNQIVEQCGWLSMSEFTDLITIAEMTPGPVAINSATFVGIRVAGLPGAVIATAGCILPSCILVSVLAVIYRKYRGAPAVSSVLSGLRPAVVALIASAGLSILLSAAFTEMPDSPSAPFSAFRPGSAILFLVAFAILRIRKWNPVLILCLCGAAGLLTCAVTGSAGYL